MVAASFGLQLWSHHSPWLARFFKTALISASDCAILLAISTVPLLVHATKQILDTWGSDGWELVQVVAAPGGGDQVVAYLKRPLA